MTIYTAFDSLGIRFQPFLVSIALDCIEEGKKYFFDVPLSLSSRKSRRTNRVLHFAMPATLKRPAPGTSVQGRCGICGLVFACQFMNRLASAGLALYPTGAHFG